MSIRAIIALAGRAGAGKDTTAGLLKEPIWTTFPNDCIVVTGFARRMKKALQAIFDIDFEALDRDEKERKLDQFGLSPRQLMQSLGTEWGRSIHQDLWVMLMERQIFDTPGKHDEVWILTDCRFPNEIAWVKRKGGTVWWVERDGVPAVAAHSSENSIGPQDCDRTIANFGTPAELQVTVERAWAQHVAAMEIEA